MIARLRQSVVFYATMLTYLSGVIVLLLVVQIASLGLGFGLTLLTVLTMFVLLVTMRRDLSAVRSEGMEVHSLVNAQHDDLCKRIKQLTDALIAAGIEVPRDLTGEGPDD